MAQEVSDLTEALGLAMLVLLDGGLEPTEERLTTLLMAANIKVDSAKLKQWIKVELLFSVTRIL